MRLKAGDVFDVLDGGRVVTEGHPFVILLIKDSNVFYSNITDIENEDYVDCVLYPQDDPAVVIIKSTFRYRSIDHKPIPNFDAAFESQAFRHRGQLAKAAFDKIIAGIWKCGQIKPIYRKILQESIKQADTVPAMPAVPPVS